MENSLQPQFTVFPLSSLHFLSSGQHEEIWFIFLSTAFVFTSDTHGTISTAEHHVTSSATLPTSQSNHWWSALPADQLTTKSVTPLLIKAYRGILFKEMRKHTRSYFWLKWNLSSQNYKEHFPQMDDSCFTSA